MRDDRHVPHLASIPPQVKNPVHENLLCVGYLFQPCLAGFGFFPIHTKILRGIVCLLLACLYMVVCGLFSN